jgi:hypothetical protein
VGNWGVDKEREGEGEYLGFIVLLKMEAWCG